MITYVIVFEESRLVPNTHFTYHFYRKHDGNRLEIFTDFDGSSLDVFLKQLEDKEYLRLKSDNAVGIQASTDGNVRSPSPFKGITLPTLTGEEIFLNDVGRIYGVFFNNSGQFLRTEEFVRYLCQTAEQKTLML